jgi:hypothetical protein
MVFVYKFLAVKGAQNQELSLLMVNLGVDLFPFITQYLAPSSAA